MRLRVIEGGGERAARIKDARRRNDDALAGLYRICSSESSWKPTAIDVGGTPITIASLEAMIIRTRAAAYPRNGLAVVEEAK